MLFKMFLIVEIYEVKDRTVLVPKLFCEKQRKILPKYYYVKIDVVTINIFHSFYN